MTDQLADEFTQLVATYQPLVFRWAVGLTGDGDEADDVMQDVFVQVHRSLHTFRGDGHFEGWLYRITRRIALRREHRGQVRRRIADSAMLQRTNEVYLTDPGARVDREDAVRAIGAAVAALPPRQREVLSLCDLQGLSPADAAVLLDMKAVTVRANLFKARATIRRSLLQTHPQFRETDNDVR